MRGSPGSVLRSRSVAGAGLAFLILLATAVLLSLAPPRPLPADTAPDRFSADRAMGHVEALAGEPRPVGSKAHARARDYLLSELSELGLEPEVQTSTRHWVRGERTLAGRVENVVARRPGTDSSGAVLLMAHYDSRTLTPGAGDDASGVAALLEAARALAARPAPRNDLVLLFTDGEELALLGASAFAEEHRWSADVAAVFNFEARGNRGRALMFETGAGNLREARNLLATPHPVANSLSAEVYRRMPNDTDFTVFRRRGLAGMNFAFIGGHPAYHSMLDTPERLSRGSLQHHGEYAVAVATRYGEIDLADRSAEDAVYFNPFSSWLVVYPAAWVVPLASVAAVAWVAGFALARARRRVTVVGALGACGLLVGLVAVSALVGFAFWWLLERVAAGDLQTPHGLPYASDGLTLALGLLILALVARASTALRRALGPQDLAAAVALLWTVLSLATALTVPGASYLFVWPSLAASLVLIAEPRGGDGGAGIAAVPLWTFAAAITLLLWLPTAQGVSEALSLRLAPAVAVIVLLALLPWLPLLRSLQEGGGRSPEGMPRHAPAVLAAIGLAVGGVCVATTPAGPERPLVDSLVYLQGPEPGQARWLSFDTAPGTWTRHALGDAPEAADVAVPSLSGVRWQSSAPGLDLPAPDLEVLAERRSPDNQRRELVIRLRSPRGAPVLRLDAEASVPLRLVGIEGEAVVPEGDGGRVLFVAFGVPAEGITATLEVAGRWPVEAVISDQSFGLPGGLALPARPPDRISDLRWQTESVWVARRALF